MSFWPDHLIGELAQRRCIVFLGAGASAGSKNSEGERLPGWDGLLRQAVGKASSDFDKTHALALIEKERYLDAAEVVFGEANGPEFRQFIKSSFDRAGFEPSDIHRTVAEIDPKIVVTTNFDTIYETYVRKHGGYTVVRHNETHLLDEVRSQERVIVKVHGCATDAAKAVLTRSQFFKARKENPATFSVLDAVFTVNTALFVGYRLADPDIQLILENSNISAPTLHPHYALMSKGEHRSILAAIRRTYNVQVLEYDPKDHHAEASQLLQELLDAVSTYRQKFPG